LPILVKAVLCYVSLRVHFRRDKNSARLCGSQVVSIHNLFKTSFEVKTPVLIGKHSRIYLRHIGTYVPFLCPVESGLSYGLTQ